MLDSEALKELLDGLLYARKKYQVYVGAEVYLSKESITTVETIRSILTRNNIGFAVHLPFLESLSNDDLKKLSNWLNLYQPEYAVVHGCSGNMEYEDLCNLTVEKLSILSQSGVDIFVENTVPVDVDKNNNVKFSLCAGMLSEDLKEIADRSNCNVLIDTEHLLQTIFTIRDWNIPGSKEDVSLNRFGFAVNNDKIVCPYDKMKEISLGYQLATAGAERYHLSGSKSILTNGRVSKHTEILDTPFHDYLISTVLETNPKSITIESCLNENNKYDLGVVLRSFRRVVEAVAIKRDGQLEFEVCSSY